MTQPMNSPFPTPAAPVVGAAQPANNSGGGKSAEPPPGIKGWSWGAFLWNWIWAIGNQTWIGLLALVPLIGFFVAIYLGIRGRELAWQNRRWDSVEHFQRVQRAWSMWGLIVLAVAVLFAVAQVALQLNRV